MKEEMPDRSHLIVIALAKAKPGQEKKLEQALCEVGEPTRAQRACVLFSLYRSLEDSSTIIGFERWASREDHDRHLQGAQVQELMSAMAELLAQPPQALSYEIVDEK
jgi:quinol monooxygenase YgiN